MTDHRTIEDLKFAKLTIKDVVYGYMAIHPKTTNKGIYKNFPNLNRSSVRGWKNSYHKTGLESEQLVEQLAWIYDLMNTKIRKGLPPGEKDKARLKVIEKIIGLREV